jgi:hypothetical protein
MEPAPMMPNPPALLTAEANSQPEHHIIPACMMGNRMPKSVQILLFVTDMFNLCDKLTCASGVK